jgi:predicted nucleotidyltransferase
MKEIEIKILATFFPYAEREYTTKEIETISNYSHERVYTTLLKLAEKGYLIKRKVGKAYVFRLNLAKDLLLPYLYFQTEKYDKFLKSLKTSEKNLLTEFINKISSPNLVSCIVFGSYAKGEQREDSDIDILCIAAKRYDIEGVALSLRHKYGKRISPLVIQAKDFKNIKKENPTFFLELKQFGIVVYGREMFYNLVYGNQDE